MSKTNTVPEVKADDKTSEEYKQYQALRTKFAAIEAAEAERLAKVNKRLGVVTSWLRTTLRALSVKAQEVPEVMKAIEDGMEMRVDGKITIAKDEFRLNREYVYQIRLVK